MKFACTALTTAPWRSKTKRSLRLGGHQASYSFTESPCLKELRQRAVDMIPSLAFEHKQACAHVYTKKHIREIKSILV